MNNNIYTKLTKLFTYSNYFICKNIEFELKSNILVTEYIFIILIGIILLVQENVL